MKITHVVKAAIPVVLCLLFLPAFAWADSIIYFVDGTSTHGDIRKSGISNYLITRENGKWEIVPASDIKAIRNGNEITYLDSSSTPENVSATQTKTPAAPPQQSTQEKLVNPEQYKDKIYLDDGQVLSGNIVFQNTDTVTIVSESGQTDTVNTKYIKRISKTDSQPILNTNVAARTESTYETNNSKGFYYKNTNEKKTDEFVIKAGPNISGHYKITDASIYMEYYGTDEFSGSGEVDMGLSLSGEYAKYVHENMGLGFGFTYQLPRQVSVFNAKFSYIPIYALVKIRTVPDGYGRCFYAVGQLGYNSFSGSDEMKYLFGKLTGGLYTGIGGGYSADTVVIEFLYTTHQGSFKDSGDIYYYDSYAGYAYDLNWEQKGKFIYSCLSINAGVKF